MDAVLLQETETLSVRRVRRCARCASCNAVSRRHSTTRRRLRHLGLDHPVVLEVTQSVHYCAKCQKHFKLPIDDLAEPGSLFTRAVKEKALASVFADSLPIQAVVLRMLRDFHVQVPPTTLYYWMGKAGKKSHPQRRLRHLGQEELLGVSGHRRGARWTPHVVLRGRSRGPQARLVQAH